MFYGLVLIMVDECGCEVEVKRYSPELVNKIEKSDKSGMEFRIWQFDIISEYREKYKEARRFYFEDRRSWRNMVTF